MTTFTTASFLAIFLLICSTFNPHSTLVHAQDDLTDADNQLFEASANEDTDAALAALKAGANINARSKGGLQTPLMQSVLFGREKMVKFFLEQGADVTIGERDGYTPMHGAGFQGRVAIAEMLKQHGVPLREKHQGDQHEPAIRTCWGREDRHTETLRWFLDNGVPVDDLYDICMMSSSNEKTKSLLKERKEKKDEL